MVGSLMNDLTLHTKLEERMVIKATEGLSPISGSFELTPLCNLHCRMCYIHCSKAECDSHGGLLTVDEWLKFAEQLMNEGTLFLLLTGGEPFLYPGFKELYKSLREMGFILTLNTNGTLIGKSEAEFLAEWMPRRVNVTLYGASPESYRKVTGSADAYDMTMTGIRNLLDAGVPVKLNASLIKDNVEELEDLYRIANELDIPIEVNTYMYPVARQADKRFDLASRLSPEVAAKADLLNDQLKLNADTFTLLLDQMAKAYPHIHDEQPANQTELIPCRAARSSLWINWQGQMHPCVFLDQKKIDLKEYSVSEAWQMVTESRKELPMPAKCSSCRMRNFCLVCGAAAWHENGNMEQAPEYLCRMTKEKLRLAYEQVHQVQEYEE